MEGNEREGEKEKKKEEIKVRLDFEGVEGAKTDEGKLGGDSDWAADVWRWRREAEEEGKPRGVLAEELSAEWRAWALARKGLAGWNQYIDHRAEEREMGERDGECGDWVLRKGVRDTSSVWYKTLGD